MRILRPKIKLNNSQFQTLQEPLAIGIFYNLNEELSYYYAGGYLFDSHSRQVLIEGSNRETLFWDLCVNCPLYKKRQCSGGYKTLTSSPGYRDTRILKNDGDRTVYYNKEFCKMHYRTEFWSQKLSAADPTTIQLLPFFFFLKEGVPYWFLYRPSDSALEFLPYQIFNTYGSGEICLGGVSSPDPNSVPRTLEHFFSRSMNRDLNPTNNTSNTMSPIQWARAFSPEKLQEVTELQWGPIQHYFNNIEFELVPPRYKNIRFIKFSTGEAPSSLNQFENRTLCIVQDYQDRWFCTKDLSTRLVDIDL